MKRRELIRHLEAGGCRLLREPHTIYTNPSSGVREAVPRHPEIKKHLARSICRHLGVEVPKGAVDCAAGSAKANEHQPKRGVSGAGARNPEILPILKILSLYFEDRINRIGRIQRIT